MEVIPGNDEILSAIKQLGEELRDIKNRLDREEWKKDFLTGLTAIRQLVEKTGTKLNAETDPVHL
jgi:hypothetical protein